MPVSGGDQISKRQHGSVDYLMLFLVVLLAVIIGNLTSDYIELKWAEKQASKALALATEKMREVGEEQRERNLQHQRQLQTERAKSPMGRKLERACQDWTKADQANNTTTTRDGRRQHCNRYNVYVETGRAP